MKRTLTISIAISAAVVAAICYYMPFSAPPSIACLLIGAYFAWRCTQNYYRLKHKVLTSFNPSAN